MLEFGFDVLNLAVGSSKSWNFCLTDRTFYAERRFRVFILDLRVLLFPLNGMGIKRLFAGIGHTEQPVLEVVEQSFILWVVVEF